MAEAPESVRRKSAHVLGVTLLILGVLSLGAAALEFIYDTTPDMPLVVAGVLAALVAVPGGFLEYRRDHRGEALAALAFALAFIASALLLMNAYWWYIPLLGATNLIVMILLMWRVATRSESNVEAQKDARAH